LEVDLNLIIERNTMAPNLEVMGNRKTYQSIKADLCGRLGRGSSSNGRLPPIRKLAKDLGVGQSSLHQAVKELVTQGLLISKPKLGTFINASPEDFRLEQKKTQNMISNAPADHPLSQKWTHLLYYRSAMAERFYQEAAESFTTTLAGLGMKVTKDYLETEHSDQLLKWDQPNALVIINPTQTLKLACGQSQALIAINTTQHCNLQQRDRFDLITIDDIQGGIVAGEYLRKNGWTEVCFIGISSLSDKTRYDKTSQDRLEGLTRGLGSPIPPAWQIQCSNYDMVYGAIAVSEWLKLSPRPEAVFAVSDDIAFGFINGALSHGLQPGRDYQIIGLDGQQMGKELGAGTLTTVAAPIADMGKMAAKLLIDRFNNPQRRSQRILLGCDLIEGDTVTPKPR
jgi:DNA-binding LacI/PurR family transcriptional regulator